MEDLQNLQKEIAELRLELHTNRRIILNIGRKIQQFLVLTTVSGLALYVFNTLDEPAKIAVKQNWLTNGIIAVLSSAAVKETFNNRKLKEEENDDRTKKIDSKTSE